MNRNKAKHTAQVNSGLPILSGTAADIAISASKLDRETTWECLASQVGEQVATWERPMDTDEVVRVLRRSAP